MTTLIFQPFLEGGDATARALPSPCLFAMLFGLDDDASVFMKDSMADLKTRGGAPPERRLLTTALPAPETFENTVGEC